MDEICESDFPTGSARYLVEEVRRVKTLKRGTSVKRASVSTMAKAREVDQASLHCKRQEKVISLSCVAIQVVCAVAPLCLGMEGNGAPLCSKGGPFQASQWRWKVEEGLAIVR